MRRTWNDLLLLGFRPEPSYSSWTYHSLAELKLQARQEQALREKRAAPVEARQLELPGVGEEKTCP